MLYLVKWTIIRVLYSYGVRVDLIVSLSILSRKCRIKTCVGPGLRNAISVNYYVNGSVPKLNEAVLFANCNGYTSITISRTASFCFGAERNRNVWTWSKQFSKGDVCFVWIPKPKRIAERFCTAFLAKSKFETYIISLEIFIFQRGSDTLFKNWSNLKIPITYLGKRPVKQNTQCSASGNFPFSKTLFLPKRRDILRQWNPQKGAVFYNGPYPINDNWSMLHLPVANSALYNWQLKHNVFDIQNYFVPFSHRLVLLEEFCFRF